MLPAPAGNITTDRWFRLKTASYRVGRLSDNPSIFRVPQGVYKHNQNRYNNDDKTVNIHRKTSNDEALNEMGLNDTGFIEKMNSETDLKGILLQGHSEIPVPSKFVSSAVRLEKEIITVPILENGKRVDKRYRIDTYDKFTCALAVRAGERSLIFAGDSLGRIHQYRPDTGGNSRYSTGSPIKNIAFKDGRIIAVNSRDEIIVIKPGLKEGEEIETGVSKTGKPGGMGNPGDGQGLVEEDEFIEVGGLKLPKNKKYS